MSAHGWKPQERPLAYAGLVVPLVGVLAVIGVGIYNHQPPADDGPASKEQAGASAPPAPTDYLPSGGWGPGRETFVMKTPPGYPVLNSIVDSPAGDQRQFANCQSASDSSSDSTSAIDGVTEVKVTVAIDNNATVEGKDIEGARMQLKLPTQAVQSPSINVHLLSSGRVPEMWAGCHLVSHGPIVVGLKPGTGNLYHGRGLDAVNDPIPDGVIRGVDLLPNFEGGKAGQIPASTNPVSYGYLTFVLVAQPIGVNA